MIVGDGPDLRHGSGWENPTPGPWQCVPLGCPKIGCQFGPPQGDTFVRWLQTVGTRHWESNCHMFSVWEDEKIIMTHWKQSWLTRRFKVTEPDYSENWMSRKSWAPRCGCMPSKIPYKTNMMNYCRTMWTMISTKQNHWTCQIVPDAIGMLSRQIAGRVKNSKKCEEENQCHHKRNEGVAKKVTTMLTKNIVRFKYMIIIMTKPTMFSSWTFQAPQKMHEQTHPGLWHLEFKCHSQPSLSQE